MISLAKYIMQGRIQAMIVASSLALLSVIFPPVSIVSSATVALVSLRRGAFDGFYVLVCSGLVVALLGLFLLGSYQFALAYVAVLWLPICLIALVLRATRQLVLAIESALLIGIVGIMAFYFYNSPVNEWWKSFLTQMIPANAPVADITRMIDIMSHYMTGVMAAGSVFGLLISLFLARWWQASLYNPGGFREEFLNLSSSNRLAGASLLIISFAGLSSGELSEMLWNATILLFVLYSLIGTAVLHVVCARMKQSRYSVPLFYITLFLIPHALLLVALIGLIDPWLNLRKNTNS